MNELGVRLRETRIRHGWTLDGLSERCGLSPSFLSQVERGLSTLSIVSLSAICAALDLPIETLFSSSGPLDQRALRVTAADRQLLIRIGDSPVSYRYLSGQLPSSPIAELLIAEFPAGCDQRDSAHEGQEMGYVLEGVLELRVGEEEHRLSSGDSYRIDASEPHDYRTPSDLGARVLMAVTQRFIEVPRENESEEGRRVSNEIQ
jgi:transcriptional regulator with XRE-family HTH domain